MCIKLSFLGGAGTVTGSKYLLESASRRILVDCGLFQGYKQLRLRNWAPPPVDPRSIDAVILTHAHIDHSGYLPVLAKQGFGGKVYCSRATRELSEILLPVRLNERRSPMIIVSASGMATGGRVLHHLKTFAPDAKNTILFTGFQAGGTRGAAMLAGADAVKIFGEYVPVRAEVAMMDSLSAHADYREILDWLGNFAAPPKQTYIVHGEPGASDALRHRIEEQLRWPCRVPEHLETAELA